MSFSVIFNEFSSVLPEVTSLTSPMVAEVGNAGCQAGLTWQVALFYMAQPCAII